MSAQHALAEWGLQDAVVTPLGNGLINETYQVTAPDGRLLVLQGLNAVFAPQVNIDIDTLTRHLDELGLKTQRLLPTTSGALWCEVDGRAWRLATFVPGICRDMLESGQQADTSME